MKKRKEYFYLKLKKDYYNYIIFGYNIQIIPILKLGQVRDDIDYITKNSKN